MKKFIALCLGIIMSFSLLIPASAIATNQSVDQFQRQQAESINKAQKQDDDIKLLQSYLTLTSKGNIVLSAPKNIINKIGQSDYNILLAGVAQTNEMIDKGYLKCDSNFNISVTQEYLNSDSQLKSNGNSVYLNSQGTLAATAASGINAIVWYWWGFKLYLDSTNSNKVAAGLSVATAVAVLIPDPTLSKAVALALGVVAGLYAYANAAGRGTYARFNYAPPVTPLLFTGVFSQ